MSHAINRRKALTIVAAGPAVALATPTLASVGEDAELHSLFRAWLTQYAVCEQAHAAASAVEEKVWEESERRWKFDSIVGCFKKDDSWFARFIVWKDGEPVHRDLQLDAADIVNAVSEAQQKESEFFAEAERSRSAAKRRHKWKAVDRARNLEVQTLTDIEDEIGAAPAAGLQGVAIKLAIWRYAAVLHDEERQAGALSAYETVSRLAGIDPVAELPEV